MTQATLPSLGPQSFSDCVWSLGVHHAPGTPAPSQYLLKQLASCLAEHLTPIGSDPSPTPAPGPADEATAPAAVPAVPEPTLSSVQLVAAIDVLSRLGAGEHSPPGLTARVCGALSLEELDGEELVAAVAALSAFRRDPPGAEWLDAAAGWLLPTARRLPAEAAARCVRALAELRHRPGAALMAELVSALAGPVLSAVAPAAHAAEQPPSNEAVASNPLDLYQSPSDPRAPQKLTVGQSHQLSAALSLQAAVDAVWGLVALGAEPQEWVSREWVDELMRRLAGKVQAMDVGHVSRLLVSLSALDAQPPPGA